MVWRDVDVLQDAARRAPVTVSVSVPTVDDEVWRTTEPGTAPPRSRLEVVRRLAAAGIDVSVAMAPILPGLSDGPEQLERVVAPPARRGRAAIWANLLYLKPGTREHFLGGARSRLARSARALRAALPRPRVPPRDAIEPVRERVRELASATHPCGRPASCRKRRPEPVSWRSSA